MSGYVVITARVAQLPEAVLRHTGPPAAIIPWYYGSRSGTYLTRCFTIFAFNRGPGVCPYFTLSF